MYCAACDRTEWDDLGIDTETCLRCGGFLCASDDDDEWWEKPEPIEPDEFDDDFNNDITEGEKIDA